MSKLNFLNSKIPAPKKVEMAEATMPSRFLNRELSWLAFNWRVLEVANDDSWPLLERLRMLSISSSNLDEFFSVRVAGVRELLRNGILTPTADGLSPSKQLELIDNDSSKLMQKQQHIWAKLKLLLGENQIEILDQESLTNDDRTRLNSIFLEEIFPIASPMAVDPAHPFPFIHSGGLALALHFERKKGQPPLHVLLPIPAQTNRFVEVSNDESGTRLFPLESLLLEVIENMFPNLKLAGHCLFRVLRDADLEIEDESEDLVRDFESALKRRQRGDAVRLTISANAPENLRKMIFRALSINPQEVYEIDGILGLQDLSEICSYGDNSFGWPEYTPREPERVQDFDGDIFAAIEQKDMLLHHPYESFDLVVRFLEQAARDPKVVAIKQTLYRTSNQSPIVNALCAAAEAGKMVTAVVELKARFDEAANIRLSRQMERAGVHVVYGFINLKTHAKVSTVVRKSGKELTTYSHFGTGNYHPVTANVYTDLSYFTCSKPLGRDASKLFNYISGYANPEGLEKIAIAPTGMADRLLELIKAETNAANEGRPAAIWAKMNSLIEKGVIDALYEASQAGVKIDLVVRGICGLRPGVEGLSENIRVKSIVGRFLEHSRIVCFANGTALPSKKAKVFMSSADWMGRNLHGRVETMVQVTNKTVHAQILNQIMAANLADTKNSWFLLPDGSYERSVPEDSFDCHKFFMENPSLSGRGKAGAKDVPELAHSNDD